MANNFPIDSDEITAPCNDAYVVVTNNTVDFPTAFRGFYVGGTGDVHVCTLMGSNVLFVAVPAGSTLPVRGKRINQSNTTATNIVALV